MAEMDRARVDSLVVIADDPADPARHHERTVGLAPPPLRAEERIRVQLPDDTRRVRLTVRALAGDEIVDQGAADPVAVAPGDLVQVTIALGTGPPIDMSTTGPSADGFGNKSFEITTGVPTGLVAATQAVASRFDPAGDAIVLSDGKSNTVTVVPHRMTPPFIGPAVSTSVGVKAELLLAGTGVANEPALFVIGKSTTSQGLAYGYDAQLVELANTAFVASGAIVSAALGRAMLAGNGTTLVLSVVVDGQALLFTDSGGLRVTEVQPETGARATVVTVLDAPPSELILGAVNQLVVCRDKDFSGPGCDRVSLATTSGLERLIAVDADRDLDQDVLAVDATTVRLFRNTAGVLSEQPLRFDLASGTGVVVADWNLDGYPDLAYILQDRTSLEFVLLGGTMKPLAQASFTIGVQLSHLVVAYLDGDGRPDVVAIDTAGVLTPLLGRP